VASKSAKLVHDIDFPTFIRAIRHQLQISLDDLRIELLQKRQEAVPVFALDSVELTVGCRVELAGGAKASAEAQSGHILKLLVGTIKGGVTGEASATAAREGTLKVVLQPKEAYWDVDGWQFKPLFLTEGGAAAEGRLPVPEHQRPNPKTTGRRRGRRRGARRR